MASATLTIPESVKGELRQFSWINWSELAKEELIERARRDELFEQFDKMLENSEMTDELALKLGDELKKRVAKRHGL